MILVCDEDVGTGVPRALRLVDCSVTYLRKLKLAGKPDIFWLAIAGSKNWLVFSHNKKILTVPEEREVIIQEKVGIVFLTNGIEHPRDVLRLLLSKWDTLETLWETVDRPFVRFLSPNGRLRDKYRNYQLVLPPKV